MQLEQLPAPALGRIAVLASTTACPGQCLLARISRSLRARAGSLSDVKIRLVLGGTPATLQETARRTFPRNTVSAIPAAGAGLCRIHALAGWLRTHGSSVSSLEVVLPDEAERCEDPEHTKLRVLEAVGRSLAMRAVISSLCQAPGLLALQHLQLPVIGLAPASEVAQLLQRCRRLRSLRLHHSRFSSPPAEAAEAQGCECQLLGAALQQLSGLTHLTLYALSLPCLTGSPAAAAAAAEAPQKSNSSHLEQDIFQVLPSSLVELRVAGSGDALLSIGALRHLGKLTELFLCPSLHLTEAPSSSSSASSGSDTVASGVQVVPVPQGSPASQQPERPEGAGQHSAGETQPLAQLASLSSLCRLEGDGISLAAAGQLPGLTHLSTQVGLEELGRLEQLSTLRHLSLKVQIQQQQQQEEEQQQQQPRESPAWPQQLHSLDLSFAGEGVERFLQQEASRSGQGPWARSLAALIQLEALRLPHQLVTAAGRGVLGEMGRLSSLTVDCQGLSVGGVLALLDVLATNRTHHSATTITGSSSSTASSSCSGGGGDGSSGLSSSSSSPGGAELSSSGSSEVGPPLGSSGGGDAATMLLAADAMQQVGSIGWRGSSHAQALSRQTGASIGSSNSSSSPGCPFLPCLCCLTLQGITRHGQVTAFAARRLPHVKLMLAC